MTADDVFSSAYAAAFYIKRHVEPFNSGDAEAKVFVIGSAGIVDELKAESVASVMPEVSHEQFTEKQFVTQIQPIRDVRAVLVGADFDFSYRKLAMAHC